MPRMPRNSAPDARPLEPLEPKAPSAVTASSPVPKWELDQHSGWCRIFWEHNRADCSCGVRISLPPPPRLDERTRFARAFLTDGTRLEGPLALVRQVGDLAYAPQTYLSTVDGGTLVPISAVVRLVKEGPAR